MEGTLGDREEGCQGHYSPSSPGLLMNRSRHMRKHLISNVGNGRFDDGVTHGSTSERLPLLPSKPNLQSPTTNSTKHANRCESYSEA